MDVSRFVAMIVADLPAFSCGASKTMQSDQSMSVALSYFPGDVGIVSTQVVAEQPPSLTTPIIPGMAEWGCSEWSIKCHQMFTRDRYQMVAQAKWLCVSLVTCPCCQMCQKPAGGRGALFKLNQ